MPAADFDMNEVHWLMDMFNTVDIGLVVLDRNYQVCVWNGFMENHSGLLPSAVKDKDIFDQQGSTLYIENACFMAF